MSVKPLDDLLNLKGKRAIVTGGAVGIGFGISYRLAEAGAQVLIADISQGNLEEAKKNLGSRKWDVGYVLTDVAKQADIGHMVKVAVKRFGGVDILVNNAGIYPNAPVMEMGQKGFDRVLAVNLRSVFMATKAVSEQMIRQAQGGRIINITSIDALHPSSVGLAHYDASKHGVWGFTKNVALELAPHKIWVNAIAPGGISTPGTRTAQEPTKASAGIDMSKVMEAFLQRIPMRRMGEPDDIGKAVLFLASDMASYMTGTQIVVDGGVLLA